MNQLNRLILILAFSFLSNFSFCQAAGINLTCGTKLLYNPLSYPLNSFKNSSVQYPINSLGVDYTSPMAINNKIDLDGFFSFDFYVPQKFQLNDSTRATFSGLNFNLSIYSYDLLKKNENIDIIVCTGINFGRQKIKFEDNSRLKNPFVGPFVAFMPRLVFGKLNLFARAIFDLDISSKIWRKTWTSPAPSKASSRMYNFYNTGLQLQAGIGFTIGR